MNIEDLRNYCINKAHVTESFPFDESTLVFKVADKMFALTGLERLPYGVNLKCDPDEAILLRENYEAVSPAFHMNKKHWNTILLEADMTTDEIKKWIDHSYSLVVNSLTKKKQKELGFIK
ncbi:MmcQ/YjbR family DNA-binding protein [Wenyingzhuangia aestuarii]|uniref:MmcQ/YjbR family DNA-binding protein n=1 Tax=Wenyingzhuangia aestuarii TaxID=1647582 RepID=UPI00143AAE95|nr:MmcQ/YjbR family DNA-binding protein [Wenyingzhuangia aestuarii]NJB82826.1 putative DNA-binding protein (MmcQ/YjbR family) [Wenyingzhuangia aestuarii]